MISISYQWLILMGMSIPGLVIGNKNAIKQIKRDKCQNAKKKLKSIFKDVAKKSQTFS